MNRVAQGMVLILLGTAALGATVASELYLNYVQAAFRPFLIAAGLVLVALGAWVVGSDMRAALRGTAAAHDAGDGHGDHSGAPRVAWLLVLPVVFVFVVAPPALGSYTASSSQPSAPTKREKEGFGHRDIDDSDGPVRMKLREFVSRAWTDDERSMEGTTIELTGFATPNPDGEGWYLARLQMACCAADAVTNRVLITDRKAPPEDSWWTVRGTWDPPKGDLQRVRDHRFSVTRMSEVGDPPDPYE